MPIKRLAEIREQMNDCLEATVTHLNRHRILCDRIEIPPEHLREFAEFYIDWGTNMTKFGNLVKEEADLLLPLIELEIKESE